MIYILESDTHVFDKNIGLHKDYPTESLNLLKKTNEKAKELIKQGYKVGIIQEGDLEHKKFTSLAYRLEVQRVLRERKEITNNNSYLMLGNHSIVSYELSERDYFIALGDALPSKNIEENGVKIYMLDYNANPEEIIKDVNGDLNVLITHRQLQFKNSPMMALGDETIYLDDNKTYANFDYIINGHIHSVYDFEGKLYGGKKCRVIYQGCSARPTTADRQTQGSWVLIDTDKKKVTQEFYDLPPLEEVFNEVAMQINADKDKIAKVSKNETISIQGMLDSLENYKAQGNNVKDFIKQMTNINEDVKNKALEYIEKGNA